MGDADPDLERLFVVPVTDLYVWLLVHADLRQTARVRAFVDHLSAVVRPDAAGFLSPA